MQATSSVARPTVTRIPWRGLSFALSLGALIVIVYSRSPLATVAVLTSTLRQSTPIILGALAGILCERSGVINIGIEGMMLLSAFLGFMFNVWTGNLLVAVAGAVLAGGLVGALHALMSITLKVDQIISGTVINILAVGLTGYFYQQGLSTHGKLTPIPIPLLSDIP